MKIETACLEYGAPVRRIVFDDATAAAADKPAKATGGPWAWAAALARYACGEDEQKPEQSPPLEIETR